MHPDCNSRHENIRVDLYRYIPRGLSRMFYIAAQQPLPSDSALRASVGERAGPTWFPS